MACASDLPVYTTRRCEQFCKHLCSIAECRLVRLGVLAWPSFLRDQITGRTIRPLKPLNSHIPIIPFHRTYPALGRKRPIRDTYQDALSRLPSSAVNSTKPVPTARLRTGRLVFGVARASLPENIHGGFTSPIGNAGNRGAVQSPQFQIIPCLS